MTPLAITAKKPVTTPASEPAVPPIVAHNIGARCRLSLGICVRANRATPTEAERMVRATTRKKKKRNVTGVCLSG
jgi:hypothetical protein